MFKSIEKHILDRLDNIDSTLREVLKLAEKLNQFEKMCNEHFDKIDKSLDDLKQRVYKLENK